MPPLVTERIGAGVAHRVLDITHRSMSVEKREKIQVFGRRLIRRLWTWHAIPVKHGSEMSWREEAFSPS